MWTFEALKNTQFLLIIGFTFLAMMFWVTYSLKEFLTNFERYKKNRRLRHLKDLDTYRSDLKRKS